MGKMKELHMAMQEAKWEGTPNEFLTWWINNEAKKIDNKKENKDEQKKRENKHKTRDVK